MEQVTAKQYHVDVSLLRQAHDFMEAFPAVVAPNVVSFVVANMTVSSYQYPDGIRCCSVSVIYGYCGARRSCILEGAGILSPADALGGIYMQKVLRAWTIAGRQLPLATRSSDAK